MSTRDDVVTALAGLGGLVFPSVSQPDSVSARAAWPTLPRFESANAGWNYEAVWEVWVILPGDDAKARDLWFEDNAVDIALALRPVLLVESIERSAVGDLAAAVFTGRSE
jgi:hypothetical protein